MIYEHLEKKYEPIYWPWFKHQPVKNSDIFKESEEESCSEFIAEIEMTEGHKRATKISDDDDKHTTSNPEQEKQEDNDESLEKMFEAKNLPDLKCQPVRKSDIFKESEEESCNEFTIDIVKTEAHKKILHISDDDDGNNSSLPEPEKNRNVTYTEKMLRNPKKRVSDMQEEGEKKKRKCGLCHISGHCRKRYWIHSSSSSSSSSSSHTF